MSSFQKVLFHYDNEPAHTSPIAVAKLHKLRLELLPHAAHSPDLTPGNIFCYYIWRQGSMEKMHVKCGSHRWGEYLFWRVRGIILYWRYKKVKKMMM